MWFLEAMGNKEMGRDWSVGTISRFDWRNQVLIFLLRSRIVVKSTLYILK